MQADIGPEHADNFRHHRRSRPARPRSHARAGEVEDDDKPSNKTSSETSAVHPAYNRACAAIRAGNCREMSRSLPTGDVPSGEALRPKVDPIRGINLTLIEEIPKLPPWERMQANDDAVNFGNRLREAVLRANAPS